MSLRNRMSNRMRLVLASFVVAVVALTTVLAFARDANQHGQGTDTNGNATGTPPNVGHAPTGHSPTTGTVAQPDSHDPNGGGAQSGGHRSEAGSDHAGGAHHGPEAINWTDIFDKKRPAVIALVINFGVLMTLYYMLGKKPVAAALQQRRVTIGKDIEEAQALLDEANERAKKYQSELSTADADASTAKASLISSGKGEVDRLIGEAQERADRMKRDADRLVEQERKQVQLDLLSETVERAVQEASRILAKSVTADDHARLADDLLAELARRPGAIRKAPPLPNTPGGSVRPPPMPDRSGGMGGSTPPAGGLT